MTPCESLATLGIKCQSAGIIVRTTPVEIIALASDCLDVRACSSSVESIRFRNLAGTSGSRFATLENELLNFSTEVNEIDASNSALHDRMMTAETRLKD